MARWSDFERSAPEMGRSGRRMIYRFGPGLGYLATVRSDGGPRVHPICPVIVSGGLYGLIGPSPKQRDLLRDGRYALHSFPAAEDDDEFYVTGLARPVLDAATIATVRGAAAAAGAGTSGDEQCFEFLVERVLLATYKERGSPDYWPPRYQRWRAT